jgi:hypothetical protein
MIIALIWVSSNVTPDRTANPLRVSRTVEAMVRLLIFS